MPWYNDSKSAFLTGQQFLRVRKLYGEIARANGDLICPMMSGDIQEIDEANIITNFVLYVWGGGMTGNWAQHFDLDYYRRQRDGTYECCFPTLSTTREGLEKGKSRLEEALRRTSDSEKRQIPVASQ